MKKVWLITGCSTGFGRALAEELIKNSEKVVITARNPKSIEELKTNNPDKEILILKLDVTCQEDIDNAVDQTIKHFGCINVLVNNAGYGLIGALEEVDTKSIHDIFATNVFGLINLTKKVLPIMRLQKSGHIINISSVAGMTTMPGGSIYNATKFAVEGLTEALAQEVSHLGIKVTSIKPGPFRTDFAGRSIKKAAEISDYQPSVGPTRTYVKDADGNQSGDPVKAARIMIKIANLENPPLHLPLGSIGIERLYKRLDEWSKCLKDIDQLARTADFN